MSSTPSISRTIGVVLIAFTLLAVPPLALAGPGHGPGGGHPDQNNSTSGPDKQPVEVASCPDDPLADTSTTAFEDVGASAPGGGTQTLVGCTSDYVVKVTTARSMEVGTSYVAFFTVHSLDSGEPLVVDGMTTKLGGAASEDGSKDQFVTADVHGVDDLHAVTVTPAAEGQITLDVFFPTGAAAGQVTFDVVSAESQDANPASVPGFEAVAVIAGLVGAALVLGRRRVPPMAVLLVVSLAAPMAMASPGHGNENNGIKEPTTERIAGGFETSVSGLNLSASATSDEPVQLYDFGDFTTAEGPDAEHAYVNSGLYLVQMVAYDPGTLEGKVYNELVQVGDDPVNDAPTGLVLAEKRMAAFGDDVTFNASGTEERNGDDLRYVWSVGQADIDSTDFVFRIADVTESPTWNWTAPETEGDYKVQAYILDSRRGFTEAGKTVRVVETLPSDSDSWTAEGTLTADHRVKEQVDQAPEGSATLAFEMAYPGEVTATVSYTNPGGAPTDPLSVGVPDVDLSIDDDAQSLSNDNPETLVTSLSKGSHVAKIWLENGAMVDYTLTVEVDYELNPFV